jgi:acyl carrier protein
MDNLKEDLKKQIIEQLNLEDIQVSDINDDALLFNDEGLGLDSIDALELIVLLEKYHGIQVTKPEEGKEAFLSINTMADFINRKRAEKAA